MNDFYAVSLNPIVGKSFPFVDLDGLNKKPFGCVDQFGRIDAWEWWQSGANKATPLLAAARLIHTIAIPSGPLANCRNSRSTYKERILATTACVKLTHGLHRYRDANALNQNWKLDAAGNWTQFDVTASTAPDFRARWAWRPNRVDR